MAIVTLADIAKKSSKKKRTKESKPNKEERLKTSYSEIFETKPAEEVQKKYRNTTEEAQTEPAEEVQKKYRNTTEEKASSQINYRKTTGHTTEEKQKKYRNTTEEVQKIEVFLKDISLLTGKQKTAFNYLVGKSKIYGSEAVDGWRMTPPISANELAEVTSSSTVRSSREVVRELIKVKIIRKEKSKHGPGGWTIYSINPESYSKSLVLENYRSSTEEVQINYRNTAGHTTDHTTEMVSSSSSGNFSNKETTITSENIMPNDWAKVKIPDSLIELGFSPTHIKQIYLSRRGSLQAEDVQSSLHDFEYDIKNGHAKPYKGAVNLFLSVLRSKGLPWVSSDLAASEALEIDKQLKAIELKKETFEKKKLLESSAKVDLILKDLTDSEKKKILEPDGKLKAFGSFTYEMSLKGRIHEILEESGEEYFQKQQEVSL